MFKKNEENKFYENLLKDPLVQKTISGLYYKIIEKGSKELPNSNSNVVVHYEGKLINGTIFDSSKLKKPIQFNLNQVILGFKDGLQLIGKGGKIELYISPNLGYGSQALPGIPANSILIFEVEIISFDNT